MNTNLNMKASYENVNASETSSLIYHRYEQTVEDIIALHFHPEYELTSVLHGRGKRIVGGQADYFEAGDLVLLNADIPHCWMYETKKTENEIEVENLVIQFNTILIKNFGRFPEFRHIKKMFDGMKSGFVIKNSTLKYVQNQMLSMASENEFERLISLFNILNAMSVSNDLLPIDGFMNPVRMSVDDMARFQKAYSYIIANYKKNITLSEISEEVAMSETAFCRFFKKISRKTFVEFLSDYRIDAACKLLRETDKPIWDIGFSCGFMDTPHFNRTFKSKKGISPLKYRQINKL